MSFRSKIIGQSNKSSLVYLVTAKADGKPAWYYLQVDEPKHKAFQKQLATGSLDLAAYGTIVQSGWGEQPPEHIAEIMLKTFSQED
jgi:hypothetical protein